MRVHFWGTRVIATMLAVMMLLSCLPGKALGYDLHAFLKGYARSEVETSNQIIDSVKTKADFYLSKGLLKTEDAILNSFAKFEQRNWVNEQNILYRFSKGTMLSGAGFGLGALGEGKNLALWAYPIIAKIPTTPERTINLAYKIAADPEKYKKMTKAGIGAVTGVAKNPVPFLCGVSSWTYQQGVNAYREAKKGPLEFGKVAGEGTVIFGPMLLGAGQISTLAKAQKAQTAQKISTAQKVPTIFKGNPVRALTEGSKGASFRPVFAYSKEEAMNDARWFLGEISAQTSVSKEKLGRRPAFEFVQKVTDIELKLSWAEPIPANEIVHFDMQSLKKCVEAGKPLPQNRAAVDLVAELAGVDLQGVNVNIIKINSIIGESIKGMAMPGTMNLYPRAFKDAETLSIVLGHERMHGAQFEWYKNMIKTEADAAKYHSALEKGAEAVQYDFLKHFQIAIEKLRL